MSDQPSAQPPGGGYAARAPKPGVVPLAPMGIGEVFGALFATVGRCWRVLLVIGVGTALVGTAATLPAYAQMSLLAGVSPETDPDVVVEQLVDGLVWLPLAFAVSALVTWFALALVTPVVHAAVLGRSITLGQAWQRVRPQAGRLVVLAIVATLAVLVGIVLCVLPGLVLGVLWGFSAPALVVERATVGGALRRSWRLVSSQFWRVVGIVLLVGLAIGAVNGVVGQVAGLGVAADAGSGAWSGLGLLGLALSSLVTTAITVPVLGITWVLLYLDARIRVERYDIALAQAAGPSAGDTSTGGGSTLR